MEKVLVLLHLFWQVFVFYNSIFVPKNQCQFKKILLLCSVSFLSCQSEEEIEWISSKYEKIIATDLEKQERIRIGTQLLQSQGLDNFLASKFVSVKRYGGEGAESMMAFFSELLHLSAQGK